MGVEIKPKVCPTAEVYQISLGQFLGLEYRFAIIIPRRPVKVLNIAFLLILFKQCQARERDKGGEKGKGGIKLYSEINRVFNCLLSLSRITDDEKALGYHIGLFKQLEGVTQLIFGYPFIYFLQYFFIATLNPNMYLHTASFFHQCQHLFIQGIGPYHTGPLKGQLFLFYQLAYLVCPLAVRGKGIVLEEDERDIVTLYYFLDFSHHIGGTTLAESISPHIGKGTESAPVGDALNICQGQFPIMPA